MPQKCSKTGKQRSTGNRRSHSCAATRRVFKANLQKKRVFDPVTRTFKRIVVSTAYLRTLAKRMQSGTAK